MSGRTSARVALAGALVVLLVGAAALVAGRGSDGAPGEGSVDVGFLRDMAVHHEQAVRMALLVLGAEGTSPAVRASAVDVVAGQRYDLGLIDAWLDDWGHGRGPADRQAMTWMGHEPTPPGEMPGMASAAELDDLAAATGGAADARYLELMIEHHEGGVAMAEHAAARAGDAKVRRLAELIVAGQRQEAADLEALLRQLRAEHA